MNIANRSRSGSAARVLLVEDNHASRQLIGDFLRYCGYQVRNLGEGAGFIAAMNQFHPQVVLLDLKLPDVDGYCLLEELRHHPEWSEIPVIVVSAYAFQSDRQRALDLGAHQYLVKPVRLMVLKTAIDQALQPVPVR